MKFNKEFILKNLTGILCVISIVAMFLPFISVEASVSASVGGFSASASSGETVLNGFTLTTDGGLFGILLDLCIVIIIASTYVPQLKQYRKFVLAGSAILGIICLILVPTNIANALSAAGGAAGSSVKVDTKFTMLIGFWIILICYIAILAVAVIQFFGLKGNKVLDMVNAENSGEGSGNMPQLNFNADKLKEMAQNAAGNISNAASSVKDKVSNAVSSGGSSEGGEASARPAKKENPEVIMKQIKELHEMKEMGILTEEEFAAKKKEYLDKM